MGDIDRRKHDIQGPCCERALRQATQVAQIARRTPLIPGALVGAQVAGAVLPWDDETDPPTGSEISA